MMPRPSSEPRGKTSLHASRCLNALTIGLAISASIQSPPHRSRSLFIQAGFLIAGTPAAYANQLVVGQTCPTPTSDNQHLVNETEDDILRRIPDDFVTGPNSSNPACVLSSTPQCLPASENAIKHRDDGCLATQDEIETLSDELFLKAPVTGHQASLRSDPSLVSSRSQTRQKAHILTTLKKLAWLANVLFPYRLIGKSLGSVRDLVKFVIVNTWTLVRGCAMILGAGVRILWEDIIFPLLFPVRLLFHIFVIFPYRITVRIYQALKPLLFFLASAITVGVFIGIVGGMGNAVLGDWIVSFHRARMDSRTLRKPHAGFTENPEENPRASGSSREHEQQSASRASSHSDLGRLNGSAAHDGSITTATQLNESMARRRSTPSGWKPNADGPSAHASRDIPGQQPIKLTRDRSYSGSSASSRTSSILKGSRKKAGASSFAGRADSSLSGSSSKGKKKKVTFKND